MQQYFVLFSISAIFAVLFIMTERQLDRIYRVKRLLAIVKAFHHYTTMQLNQALLKEGNSWKVAEILSEFMNVIAPERNCMPSDFLHDNDEVSNHVLDNYKEYKIWEKNAESVGIEPKTLMAFCKNVENTQSVHQLKMMGHLYYSLWLTDILCYLNNVISKTELEQRFVEFNIITLKPHPANIAMFRKTLLEIEALILNIKIKQLMRACIKCVDDDKIKMRQFRRLLALLVD